jgi:Coenzyme PQQ synthesis protein D (PqqD)
VARRLRLTAAMSSDRFRVSASVRASISEDGLVLLDVQGGVVLASNPIGARIWQLVDGQLTSLEIAHQIAAEYDVSLERAHHDVDAFVQALAARGLVIEASACRTDHA